MMFLYNRNGALQAFLAQAFDQPIPYGDPCPWAVAQLFNSRDPEAGRAIERIVARACDDFSLPILGWREVPCQEAILGELACATRRQSQKGLSASSERR